VKIVAKVSEDVVLVEMSANELSHICGFNYLSDLRDSMPYRRDHLSPGSIYHPTPAWRRLVQQQDASKQLQQAAQSLRALADLVETQLPTVELVTQKAPEEEGGAK